MYIRSQEGAEDRYRPYHLWRNREEVNMRIRGSSQQDIYITMQKLENN